MGDNDYRLVLGKRLTVKSQENRKGKNERQEEKRARKSTTLQM
jgi:hypothetical protein